MISNLKVSYCLPNINSIPGSLKEDLSLIKLDKLSNPKYNFTVQLFSEMFQNI